MALAKIISWVGNLNFWLLGEGGTNIIGCQPVMRQGRAFLVHYDHFMRLRGAFDFISELSTRVDYVIERDAHWDISQLMIR